MVKGKMIDMESGYMFTKEFDVSTVEDIVRDVRSFTTHGFYVEITDDGLVITVDVVGG
jgi:hypothetical protein